jgi:hypothetical protein
MNGKRPKTNGRRIISSRSIKKPPGLIELGLAMNGGLTQGTAAER